MSEDEESDEFIELENNNGVETFKHKQKEGKVERSEQEEKPNKTWDLDMNDDFIEYDINSKERTIKKIEQKENDKGKVEGVARGEKTNEIGFVFIKKVKIYFFSESEIQQ